MDRQTESQSVFQAMKNGWKKAVKAVTKPIKKLVKKVGDKIRRHRATVNDTESDCSSLNDAIADADGMNQQLVYIKPEDRLRYSYEAEGIAIFNKVDKGKLAQSDVYIRHVKLCGKQEKQTLIWTDKRFVTVSETGKIEWQRMWTDIHSSPWLVYCCCPEQPYDELVIPYKESKVVYRLTWDRANQSGSFTVVTKSNKIFQIPEYETHANKYFEDNDLVQFCTHPH